jgi:hypothetical protein
MGVRLADVQAGSALMSNPASAAFWHCMERRATCRISFAAILLGLVT